MSFRPRPITATIGKPEWMEPQVLRRRTYSLDSSGSTASLTSVLDHESCDSLTCDEESEIIQDAAENRKDTNGKQKLNEGKQSEDNNRVDGTDVQRNNVSENGEVNLSSWEEWLVRKAKEDQKRKRLEIRKWREEKRKIEEEERKKLKNIKKALEIRKDWLEMKSHEYSIRKQLEDHRISTEIELKQQKQKEIEDKSIQNFNEWIEKKKGEKKQRKVAEKEKQKLEDQKQLEKKSNAQKSYKDWCAKAKLRPKPTRSSYGYASGKLTGKGVVY